MKTGSSHPQKATLVQKNSKYSMYDSASQDDQRTDCANPELIETPNPLTTTNSLAHVDDYEKLMQASLINQLDMTIRKFSISSTEDDADL